MNTSPGKGEGGQGGRGEERKENGGGVSSFPLARLAFLLPSFPLTLSLFFFFFFYSCLFPSPHLSHIAILFTVNPQQSFWFVFLSRKRQLFVFSLFHFLPGSLVSISRIPSLRSLDRSSLFHVLRSVPILFFFFSSPPFFYCIHSLH